jgi:hypothetical protein
MIDRCRATQKRIYNTFIQENKYCHGLTAQQAELIHLRLVRKIKAIKQDNNVSKYGLTSSDLRGYARHNVVLADLI